MKPNRSSATATLVALSRALAHGRTNIRGFSDPIAGRLLPEPMARLMAGLGRLEIDQHLRRLLSAPATEIIPLRTVAIDAAIRAAPRPQLVILGAGLDTRAWRMPELAGSTVFEVDHPASQKFKRGRVGPLHPLAREVRFVPVDFERDSLDETFESAGHRKDVPTFWLWEGVITYLERETIRSTLQAIVARSAPTSRLAATYTSPRPGTRPKPIFMRLVGEPLRTLLTSAEIAEDVRAAGLEIGSDTGVSDWALRFGGSPANAASRVWFSGLRLLQARVI